MPKECSTGAMLEPAAPHRRVLDRLAAHVPAVDEALAVQSSSLGTHLSRQVSGALLTRGSRPLAVCR